MSQNEYGLVPLNSLIQTGSYAFEPLVVPTRTTRKLIAYYVIANIIEISFLIISFCVDWINIGHDKTNVMYELFRSITCLSGQCETKFFSINTIGGTGEIIVAFSIVVGGWILTSIIFRTVITIFSVVKRDINNVINTIYSLFFAILIIGVCLGTYKCNSKDELKYIHFGTGCFLFLATWLQSMITIVVVKLVK